MKVAATGRDSERPAAAMDDAVELHWKLLPKPTTKVEQRKIM